MRTDKPSGNDDRGISTRTRFVITLVLVATVFVLVEILPLHFGSQRLPWEALLAELKRRLPRIVLIGLAVSAFLSIGSRGSGRGTPHGPDEEER